MRHRHDDRTWRGAGTRAWFSRVPLVTFVLVSFLSARHLYAEHTSASRHLASLLALMIWTAILTGHVCAGLRAREEKEPAP